MLRFAKAWLSSARPRWWTSAPQQPSPFACTTSTPCRLRSRIAASLIARLRAPAGRSRRGARRGRAAVRSAGKAPGPSEAVRAGSRARREVEHRGKARAEAGQPGDEPAQRPRQDRRREGCPEPRRIGQHGGEERPQRPVRGGPAVGLLDIGAGVVDEVHVVDARRAGRHAGEAGEAAVDVLHDLRRRGLAALQHVLHQVDAAARGIELVAEEEVGRAGRGAEAAMHAGAQDRLRRPHRRIAQLLFREVRLHGRLRLPSASP